MSLLADGCECTKYYDCLIYLRKISALILGLDFSWFVNVFLVSKSHEFGHIKAFSDVTILSTIN